MSKPSIFLATPNYKSEVHRSYMYGCLEATHRFPGLLVGEPGMMPQIDQGLYVCDRRDRLAHKFLQTGADYLLWIDSDTGFVADQVQALLDADKDVIQGKYFWKDDRALMIGVPIGGAADIQEAQSVGTGFLLCTRQAIMAACGTLKERRYRFKYPDLQGIVMGLFQPCYDELRGHTKDDGALSRHLRDAGVKMWIHHGVRVQHWGEKCYMGEPVPWSGEHALAPDHDTNQDYRD